MGVTLDRVIENLLSQPLAAANEPEEAQETIQGSAEELEEYFYSHELTDGLPFVLPTHDRVEVFLRFTDRKPDEVLGVLLPDSRPATIRSIAVNGVMAGCRPEYMPILVALVEAMADPYYGVEHSGNTPGGDTLIILNGPIIKQLGFNYTQGVMRDGFRPNTSVGRFWRLYLRNVAGFLLHKNDKATFGNTWRVVVAENEDAVSKIGWQPLSADMGFKAGTNTVTVVRFTGGNHLSSVSGSTPEEMLPFIADGVVRQISWQLCFTISEGTNRPLVLLTPILAETMAAAGWSKEDFKCALFEQARLPAHQFERIVRDWTVKPVWNLAQEVRFGRIPKVFGESDDPNRMVPVVWEPEDFLVVVTGDPLRNSAYAFVPNGYIGHPTCKEISLPGGWEELRLDSIKASAA